MQEGHNLGLKGAVEAGKGIIGGGILRTLFFDIILFVFLVDGIDPEKNVNHNHFAPFHKLLVIFFIFFGD